MTHILELPHKDFKVAVTKKLYKIKVNTFEINGRYKVLADKLKLKKNN